MKGLVIPISERKITVGNSRANGQAERYIRTLKDVLRKYLAKNPASYWSDMVPYALLAMRMTVHSAHGMPPFTVVTGRYPSLPSHILPELSQPPGEPAEEEEE